MKILIVKTSSLGDLIHVFPVIEYLRTKHPAVQIDWVVEKPFAELVKVHPGVDNVLTVQTKAWRKSLWKQAVWQEMATFRRELQRTHYDVVFDLQGNTKSGLITGLASGREKVGFARDVVPESPNMLFTSRRYSFSSGKNIRADYLSVVKQYYQDSSSFRHGLVRLSLSEEQKARLQTILGAPELNEPHRVVVCSGSMWPNKQLSLASLSGFLKLIHEDRPSSFLFAWGSAEEKEVASKLCKLFPENSIVLERLPLPTLQNLMAEVDLVVSMDSLPLHLAGTTGTPTFGAFGASLASKYKPEGIQHKAVQGGCPYGRQFDKRCPILRSCPTGACIKDLTPEALFAAYKKN